MSDMTSPHGHPFSLDEAVVNRGAQLLNAQCWLWGQDIRSPHGDLLEASGLRTSTFEGARSHRRYYGATLVGDRFVVAWGGGLLFGDQSGSLFFRRLQFAPTRLNEVHSLEALPDLNAVHESSARVPPDDDRLLLEALDWLVAYEREIPRLAGTAWRGECARLWSEIEEGAHEAAASAGVPYEQLPPLPPNGLADEWRELRSLVDGSTARRP